AAPRRAQRQPRPRRPGHLLRRHRTVTPQPAHAGAGLAPSRGSGMSDRPRGAPRPRAGLRCRDGEHEVGAGDSVQRARRTAMRLPETGLVAARALGDAVRSRWFLAAAACFLILSLGLSLFGVAGAQRSGLAGFDRTTASLLNL